MVERIPGSRSALKTRPIKPKVQMPKNVLVEISFAGNPKVSGKTWIARVTDRGIEFERAIDKRWRRGVLTWGEFELIPGAFYIVKVDRSSWRNKRAYYRLYRCKPGVEGDNYVSGHMEFLGEIAFDPYSNLGRTPDKHRRILGEAYRKPPEGVRSMAIYALTQLALHIAKGG